MSALSEWESLLGDRATDKTGPYVQNLTEFRARDIAAVLQPSSSEEVREIVRIAIKYKVPLYPISTGKNWGLGSRLPVKDGCAIVDLGRMNRILEINEELQYAVVEPGVTQRQLADALADSPCMLNITGSGEHTSILGNALERGVGVLGQRTKELRGLEAVLGNGELIRTGHWSFDASTTQSHHYPEGYGPDVMGLFVQSGFGIVTSAVIGLYTRQKVELALLQSTEHELVTDHIDALRRLRQEQLLRDRIEINREDDPRLYGLDSSATDGPWLTWLVIWGDEPVARAVKQRISETFRNITYYSEHDDNLPEPVSTRFHKVKGEPGDEYVSAMAGHDIDGDSDFALDQDISAAGFVCVLPAIPFTGRDAQQTIAIIKQVDSELGTESNLTFNSTSPSGLEGFFRVSFDRTDPAQVSAAHKWAKLAQDRLAAKGFYPTRTSIENMLYQSGHLEMALNLKKAVDPHGIIAPGRYLPD